MLRALGVTELFSCEMFPNWFLSRTAASEEMLLQPEERVEQDVMGTAGSSAQAQLKVGAPDVVAMALVVKARREIGTGLYRVIRRWNRKRK